jgi:hypothetical protein
MIRLSVSTLNPKFEVEIETADKDYKKVRKLFDYVVEKLRKEESSSVISVPPPSLPLSVPTDFKINIDDGEKINTHMDL